MENNLVILEVVKNHIEEKELNGARFQVYTFTDFSSGHSFDCWVSQNIEFIDKMNLLLEKKMILFQLIVKKEGKIKLVPVKEVK